MSSDWHKFRFNEAFGFHAVHKNVLLFMFGLAVNYSIGGISSGSEPAAHSLRSASHPVFLSRRAVAVWPARHPLPAIFLDRAAPPARAAKLGPTRRARAPLSRFRISLPRRAEVRLSFQ